MIKLDCYTNRIEIYEYAKLKKGIECYPEWWKNLPLIKNSNTLNMKTCYGFTELYKKSFIIPMWCDFFVSLDRVGPEGAESVGRAECSDSRTLIGQHSLMQFEGFVDNRRYQQLKLCTPWIVYCNKDIRFSMIGTFWNTFSKHHGIHVPPGMLTFKYQHAVNVNLFFERDDSETKEFMIPFATPLVHLIPHTEEKIVLNHHLISNEEFKQREDYQAGRLSFLNWVKRKKNYAPKKCPFGF